MESRAQVSLSAAARILGHGQLISRQAVEALLARSSGKEALAHAIRAAELYMGAASEAPTRAHAATLRRRCHELIVHAEKLKSQHDPSSLSGQSEILVRASRLHGNDFPPWTSEPRDDEFELRPGEHLFTDATAFTLSKDQADNFAAWTRPAALFGLDSAHDETQHETLMMGPTDTCDLVQDITTDCSVVASLSAAAKVLLGRRAVLSSIIHPFDHAKGRPKLSASGKYVLRMNFNGCARRVVVDDRLPASHSNRTLFVVDRQSPCLLWPALLEKAYLKVRGGYDFPGSNSGTDLWVLMGWIPEQLFLQREDLDLDEMWNRIKAAHDAHDVVVTLGTGRISAEEERNMGLIGEHDYAVEDLDTSDGGTRRLLIKNPWCDASLATGTKFMEPPQDLAAHNTMWMALEGVAQHFESMFLNWNPGLFPHRQDHHFAWETPPKNLCVSLVRNPQFTVAPTAEGTVWILVSRHFVDAELDMARKRRTMAAEARPLGFMSILIFDDQEHRLQVSGAESYRGPYVDSLQTLARLEACAGQRFTVVLDQQELLLPSYTLTMTFFSHAPIEVKQAEEKMSHFREHSGSWRRRSAGGSSSCATYFQNPQYRLSIDTPAPVSILLSTDNRDVHVHIDLVWARGERVMSLRARDLVASSGEYRRGCVVAETQMLEPGHYTLVCSTFEAGQMAAFAVRVSSMAPVALEPLPANAAGMLRIPLTTLNVAQGGGKRRAPLEASWLTRASVSMHDASPSDAEDGGRQSSSLLVRVSVVHGWGPGQVTMAVSGEGEFLDSTADLRTADFDMEPERIHREGLWLVVECIGSHRVAWAIGGEILSDSPVKVGAWEPL